MSAHVSPAQGISVRHSDLQIVTRRPESLAAIRIGFWAIGLIYALAQTWIYRYQTSADSISYLDMSDGVMAGGDWHRLINGTWSPLYPFLLGLFRRTFGISPAHEVLAGHLLNVGFFVLAFLCFEFFLTRFLRRTRRVASDAATSGVSVAAVPAWPFAVLAYALFVWGSVAAISLEYLRPDMLMSCFVYVAAGILMNMAEDPARWRSYLALGAVLGIGVLAKEAMLPLAVLILAISLFLVENWRPAIKMATVGFAIVLGLGALYFVPLSRALGKFTLGETGGYNYLVHVDRAGPDWYLENPGKGSGTFLHPPLRIFSSPAAYAFDHASLVTHPLRFDPSEWMQGVRPRFAFKRQIGETYASFVDLCRSLRWLWGPMGALALFAALSTREPLLRWLKIAWPILLIGVAGCGMYVAVHVEARYVGVFLILFFCAALGCCQNVLLKLSRRIVIAETAVIVVSLLIPTTLQLRNKYSDIGRSPNLDASAANDLSQFGIRPGDRVGRISNTVTDLAIERIARVEVVAEVDFAEADTFWTAPMGTQHQVLQALASHGARVVIATRPHLNDENKLEWRRLAMSQYWAWFPRESPQS